MVPVKNNKLESSKDDQKNVHVSIGELVVDAAPIQLATVLGSCIALALYVPSKKIGGLAHILIQGVSFHPLK